MAACVPNGHQATETTNGLSCLLSDDIKTGHDSVCVARFVLLVKYVYKLVIFYLGKKAEKTQSSDDG